MRILKAFFTVVAVLLTAAMLAAGISALTRQDNGGETGKRVLCFLFCRCGLCITGPEGAFLLPSGALPEAERRHGLQGVAGPADPSGIPLS